MTSLQLDRRAMVLLSVQRALLGVVSAALRAVVVDYSETSITVTSYFDGEISEDDAESMSCVETEVVADFAADDRVEVRCVRCDVPHPIDGRGVWAYQRRE